MPSDKPKSWRDVLPIHPAAELFPMLPPDELKALGEDIKEHGLLVLVVLWEERKGAPLQLLDGRNRLDAMEAAGMPVLDREGKWLRDEVTQIRGGDPYAYVIAANIHRRHLTTAQRIELVERLIKANPQMSARRASKLAGVSPTTGAKARDRLEQRGDVSTVDTSVDTKGRQQPAHKPPTAKALHGVCPPDPPKPKLDAKAIADRAEERSRQTQASAEQARQAAQAVLAPEQANIEPPPSEENPIRIAWLNASNDQRQQFAEAHGCVAGEMFREGRRGPDAPISDRIYETCEWIEGCLDAIRDAEEREEIQAQYEDVADKLEELRDRTDDLIADEEIESEPHSSAPAPRVLNAKSVGKQTTADRVYVGRPGKWGNPFKLRPDATPAERDEVIAKYRAWIATRPALMAALAELRGKDLICCCAPLPCHADVLLELANAPETPSAPAAEAIPAFLDRRAAP